MCTYQARWISTRSVVWVTNRLNTVWQPLSQYPGCITIQVDSRKRPPTPKDNWEMMTRDSKIWLSVDRESYWNYSGEQIAKDTYHHKIESWKLFWKKCFPTDPKINQKRPKFPKIQWALVSCAPATRYLPISLVPIYAPKNCCISRLGEMHDRFMNLGILENYWKCSLSSPPLLQFP